MSRLVISQSMLFPWVGQLEQIHLADTFVYYDDVPFSKGSFTNRVQIKTPAGSKWMTIPLRGFRIGQKIQEVQFEPAEKWRDKHISLLRQSLSGAPFATDAIEMAETVYGGHHDNLGALSRASMMALADYFSLDTATKFVDAVDLEIPGSGSDRVLEIAEHLEADTYVTGHGARKYLDHERFDSAGIDVHYMEYQTKPYPQLHGTFTPYVSGLDLVANCGTEGAQYICSNTVGWKEVVDG